MVNFRLFFLFVFPHAFYFVIINYKINKKKHTSLHFCLPSIINDTSKANWLISYIQEDIIATCLRPGNFISQNSFAQRAWPGVAAGISVQLVLPFGQGAECGVCGLIAGQRSRKPAWFKYFNTTRKRSGVSLQPGSVSMGNGINKVRFDLQLHTLEQCK